MQQDLPVYYDYSLYNNELNEEFWMLIRHLNDDQREDDQA